VSKVLLAGAIDAALFAQAQQAGTVPFELLVVTYPRRVAATIRGFVSDDPITEELTQEVFLSAFLALTTFRPENDFAAGLFTIARNAARSYLRSGQSRQDDRRVPVLDNAGGDDRFGSAPSPEEEAMAHPQTEGALQLAAVHCARVSLGLTAAGVVAISAATPLFSPAIFERWFTLPYVVLLASLALAALLLFFIVGRSLRRLPTLPAQGNAYGHWVPFAGAVGIVMVAFYGLAYSLFPWLLVDRLTIWQAASSAESLWVIFAGACVVLPIIAGYTVFSCLVFRGKATAVQY
jgi:DNA-directed RNA polymerase specialized sigma24 family protein